MEEVGNSSSRHWAGKKPWRKRVNPSRSSETNWGLLERRKRLFHSRSANERDSKISVGGSRNGREMGELKILCRT